MASLLREVEHAWRRGWQPAELVRVARREYSTRHGRLMVDAIAAQMRGYSTATVDQRWQSQLAALDALVWWEHDHCVTVWGERQGIDRGGLTPGRPRESRDRGEQPRGRHPPSPVHEAKKRTRIVNRADEDEYRQFVSARLTALRRMAFLLCRDWHTADDLVSITIGKLYRHWRRVRVAENVDAYVRGVLTHAWLDEQRRPWRRERLTGELPDLPVPGGAEPSVADRELLLDLLARLPARRRAVVVLRFYCDLSVQETADVLGITTGAVKSQSARGLESLRLLAADQLTLSTGGSQ